MVAHVRPPPSDPAKSAFLRVIVSMRAPRQPQHGIDALNELRSVLTVHSLDSMNRGSSLRVNEKGRRDEKPVTKTTRARTPRPKKLSPVTVTPAPEALVQVLVDLLLEGLANKMRKHKQREASMNPKITLDRPGRGAVVYVRQSTMGHVIENIESQRRQMCWRKRCVRSASPPSPAVALFTRGKT